MTASVYRCRDARGRLLYVGMSVNVAARLSYHASMKSWWPEVVNVEVEHFATRGQALDAESEAIIKEWPIHNVQGQPWNRPAMRPADAAAGIRAWAERIGLL